MMNNEDKKALKDFKELEYLTGGDSRVYTLIGTVNYQLGRIDKALYYFDLFQFFTFVRCRKKGYWLRR